MNRTSSLWRTLTASAAIGAAVVLTGCHPEYYSREMMDALAAYLGRGGRLMYLGGNGFYWRVSYPASHPGMIEMRRAEDGTRPRTPSTRKPRSVAIFAAMVSASRE